MPQGIYKKAGTSFSTEAAILANLWNALCPVPASVDTSIENIGSTSFSTIKSGESEYKIFLCDQALCENFLGC